MPAKRVAIEWTMFPKLSHLPFSDFVYFIKVGMEAIPSTCVWICGGASSLCLEVII